MSRGYDESGAKDGRKRSHFDKDKFMDMQIGVDQVSFFATI